MEDRREACAPEPGDRINALAAEGKLTVKDADIVVNAPILTVGK